MQVGEDLVSHVQGKVSIIMIRCHKCHKEWVEDEFRSDAQLHDLVKKLCKFVASNTLYENFLSFNFRGEITPGIRTTQNDALLLLFL